MSGELKTCPFCGGEAAHDKRDNTAWCKGCGAVADYDAWNIRAIAEQQFEPDLNDTISLDEAFQMIGNVLVKIGETFEISGKQSLAFIDIAKTTDERLRRIEEKLDNISTAVPGVIGDGYGNAWSAVCPDCGAPMQAVEPGMAVCSAMCWDDDGEPDEDDEYWHEDDDKRGEPITDRIATLENRIAGIETAGVATSADFGELEYRLAVLLERIAALERRQDHGYTRGHTV